MNDEKTANDAYDANDPPQASPDSPAYTPPPPSRRVASIDAYRGLVMFLMLAETLHLCRVAAGYPASRLLSFLCTHQSHVPWVGCTLHDMIQPSFSFLVGVAMPFSLARRADSGQSSARRTAHALWRALVLILLGVFLRSLHRDQTYWTFEDTLTQIGLGYPLLYLLGTLRPRAAWIGLAVVLVGYWAAFALWPLPAPSFDTTSVGVPADWPHLLQGFEAHWNKNTNISAAFDVWFLNLFPRDGEFVYNGGGYQTLSFIPTLGTMILGLIAGRLLRREDATELSKVGRLALCGAVAVGLGLAAHALDVCPIVKRIWTPSWTLFSGGWCFLALAFLHAVCDVGGYRRWAFPLLIFGSNAIVAYVLGWTMKGFVAGSFEKHLGEEVFSLWGLIPAPWPVLVEGVVVLAVFWMILFWLYRRRVFVRI